MTIPKNSWLERAVKTKVLYVRENGIKVLDLEKLLSTEEGKLKLEEIFQTCYEEDVQVQAKINKEDWINMYGSSGV